MKAKLDLIATCLLIVTCLAVLGSLAYQRWAPPSGPSRGSQPGDVLPAVEDLDWGVSEKTLVLAFSSRCLYCIESLPFYKRLGEIEPVSSQLVALTREPAETGVEFFSEADVDLTVLPNADLSRLGVRGTPTLMLVDNSGTVLDVWRGRLTPDQEETILASLH